MINVTATVLLLRRDGIPYRTGYSGGAGRCLRDGPESRGPPRAVRGPAGSARRRATRYGHGGAADDSMTG
eukprot:750705-Hanusia_phi.AAC.2